VISDTELRDIWADLSDDPCDFVAQYGWQRNDIVSGKQEVGMAQARGLHIDKNFATDWRGDLHVFEIKPMTQCV
jgi:hypothetical protein